MSTLEQAGKYLDAIRQVVDAVRITSSTSFSWYGAPSAPLPERVRRTIAPDVARSHLLFALRNHLYKNFYCIGSASSNAPELGRSIVSSQETQLSDELSTANGGAGWWEPGWRVEATHDELVTVRKQGLSLWVSPSDCRSPTGAALTVNGEVSLRLPKESFEISPGYYHAMSDQPLVWDEDGILVRTYWNVRPEAAADLMRGITSLLNKAGIPFTFKVLKDAVSYSRCDTAVLYMLKRDFTAGIGQLSKLARDCFTRLRPGTPAFTKELGVGIALAEDRGRGESFGEHHCEVLADGLIRAFEAGEHRPSERVEAVVEAFTRAGVDLERPYLKPGSVDDYPDRLGPRRAPRPAAGPATGSPTTTLPSAAMDIGRRLAAEAVWHEDRCNWLGLTPEVGRGGQMGLSYGALGHDLYDGTSGIALFLAMLSAVTGDEAVRRASIGAVEQALRAAERHTAGMPFGLYTGSTGVALAAASIGSLFGEKSLVERGSRLGQRAGEAARGAPCFDLLSGQAGVIIGLLALNGLVGDEAFVERAVGLGRELIARAERTRLGWSWKANDGLQGPNLTGLSHGAAGAGQALLELFDITGDEGFKEGGLAAFRYERAHFSVEAANWPDLRDRPAPVDENEPALYRTQWCHGAPGIALARLRAYELLGDPVCREEALLALATTERTTAEALVSGGLSYCLCHGLTGNGDVLLEGDKLLRESGHGSGRLPLEIGVAGAESYGANGLRWPCGIPIPGQETMGLMLGLAGIGHFYLRLQFPDHVPSVLLLRPHELAQKIEGLKDLRAPIKIPA